MNQSPEELKKANAYSLSQTQRAHLHVLYVCTTLPPTTHPHSHVCMYHPNQGSVKVGRDGLTEMGECVAEVTSTLLHCLYAVYHCVYISIMLV